MESLLRKSGFYGLIFGLAISILFVNYKDVSPIDGGHITTYKPVFDYIITILRIGIIGMFLGLFIGWKSYESKHKAQLKSYYLTVFFAVFVISIIIMMVFNW